MNRTKVIIENWQKESKLVKWAPISIAFFSLVVSIWTIYFSQQQFTRNVRPFVWALNHGYIKDNTLINEPYVLAFRVKNSPAKILSSIVTIKLDNQILFTNTRENYVNHPDEGSQNTLQLSIATINQILKRPLQEQARLQRVVSIKYQSLDGGKIYYFELIQNFIPEENQWRDVSVNAN